MLALYAIIGLGVAADVGILGAIGGGLVLLYFLASFIPSLSVAVRRLHDTGKSGWFLLLSLIPFGGLVVIVFLAMDSDPNTNKFGPVPGGKAEGLQDSLVDFDNKDLV